jgi:hypothetical protein
VWELPMRCSRAFRKTLLVRNDGSRGMQFPGGASSMGSVRTPIVDASPKAYVAVLRLDAAFP